MVQILVKEPRCLLLSAGERLTFFLRQPDFHHLIVSSTTAEENGLILLVFSEPRYQKRQHTTLILCNLLQINNLRWCSLRAVSVQYQCCLLKYKYLYFSMLQGNCAVCSLFQKIRKGQEFLLCLSLAFVLQQFGVIPDLGSSIKLLASLASWFAIFFPQDIFKYSQFSQFFLIKLHSKYFGRIQNVWKSPNVTSKHLYYMYYLMAIF